MEGEWPWLSMLIKEGSEDQYDAQVQCVGVLINCNTVLTTASCAKHSKGLFLSLPTKKNSIYVKLDLVMKQVKLEIKFELGHRVVQVQQSGEQLKRLLSIQHLQRPEKTRI